MNSGGLVRVDRGQVFADVSVFYGLPFSPGFFLLLFHGDSSSSLFCIIPGFVVSGIRVCPVLGLFPGGVWGPGLPGGGG